MYLCNGECNVGEIWMEPCFKDDVVVLEKKSIWLEQDFFLLWHQNKPEQNEFEDAAAGDWRR